MKYIKKKNYNINKKILIFKKNNLLTHYQTLILANSFRFRLRKLKYINKTNFNDVNNAKRFKKFYHGALSSSQFYKRKFASYQLISPVKQSI